MTPRQSRPATKTKAKPQERPRSGWNTGPPPGTFLFLAIAAFYVWTATSSQYAFVWGTKRADHYNLLGEGFLRGHLYLAQDPPKEMLALKDPLDPVANREYGLHDASLYNGHYYVYFGPVPVITLYLPWRLITGWHIPNNLAAVIYMLGGFLFSCMLLFKLLRACAIEPSWIMKRLLIIALALCQSGPIILRRAYMYETALAAAYCFFIGGMYFLARYMIAEKPRRMDAVLAGLFLGFTPGCRPNFAAIVAIILLGYALYQWRYRRLPLSSLKRDLLWFGGPIVACGLLLAWYNLARFGNPMEFGTSY